MLPTTITQVALVALRGGCFAVLRIVVALGRMLCRLGCLFRRMLCRQGRTSWVDAWPPSCYWCLLCGCFAAQVVIGGCFATVWKASSVMVYPLCRFSSRVAGWVAKPVVASLFLLLLLYVSFVAVCWVCSSFSVFQYRLSLVLLGRSSPVWRLQELFVNCFLLNEIRAKARSRKNKVISNILSPKTIKQSSRQYFNHMC